MLPERLSERSQLSALGVLQAKSAPAELCFEDAVFREEARYEGWLTEMLHVVSRAPGYLGREVFRPAQGRRTYTSILRFDADDHLHAWAASDARKALISRVSDLLTKGDVHEIRTGIDFWFTPERAKPPKPWKQFLLVLSAIYPLSLLIPSGYGGYKDVNEAWAAECWQWVVGQQRQPREARCSPYRSTCENPGRNASP